MNDESRKKILARRASFVAAALASVACGKEPQEQPQPCLSVPINYRPDAEAEPQPCLSVTQEPPPDAGGPPPLPCLSPPIAPQDASTPPQPCLSIRVIPDAGAPKPPPPQPCLSPKRPDAK